MALVDEELLERAPADTAPPRVRLHRTAEITAHLRSPKTLWCPGCSNGIVTRAMIDAILSLELDPDRTCVIAGIGCAGRITAYLNWSTVHTAHGRALAVATGAKAADPGLHVIVIMGDGDCVAIGGNHLIHAARRNIDVTALVFNNSIYGMTGGQMSPTTFEGDRSTTSVYGNVEQAFDICELARAAGATYVARGTPYAYAGLAQLIAGGIAHKGFSFVEAMVSCPTYYGRQNGIPDPSDMMKRQHARSVPVKKFDLEGARLHDRYPVGVLHHAERGEYTAAYADVVQRAQGGPRG
jgi:2-oxoglutarate/2-oxoacid ferredoxin oxidoreductase subunit beta